MNTENLLRHFDTVSEAPDAVARLRSLILQLGVRGKLVAQDPFESTPLCGDEVEAAMQRLISDGGDRRKWKRSETLNKGDGRFPLPPGWTWSRINDTGLYINGLAFKPTDWKQEGLPIIRIQNLSNTAKEFNYASGQFPEDHIIRNGDLLVSWSATLDAFIWQGETGVLNQHIFKVITNEDLVDQNFLFWLLKYSIRELAESEHAHGLAMMHINRGPFLAHVVAIPPRAEQQRIVAKINELMTLCDELEAARDMREARRDRLVSTVLHGFSAADEGVGRGDFAADNLISFAASHLPALTTRPEHVKTLRQGFYDLAVRGMLVPQDPSDEPVNDLLQRVANEQSQLIAARRLKLKTMETTCDEPFDLPDSWRWVRLGDLIVFGPQNGVSPKPTNDPGAPKSLTLTATTSGRFNPSHFKHVDISQHECDSYWLSPGDVLFQRGNTRDFVGIAAVYAGATQEFIFPDLMIRVRFSDHLDLQYLHTVLVSPPLRRYFAEAATGASASMPKISQSTLLNAPVPVPPLAEQHRIVEKMDRVLATCDALKERLDGAASVRSQLLESLLHQALSAPTADAQVLTVQPGPQALDEPQPVCAP